MSEVEIIVEDIVLKDARTGYSPCSITSPTRSINTNL